MKADRFLNTKFYLPPLRADWVPRPNLIARLEAGLARKLILLSAPAGFGKTTLLSQWIADYRFLNANFAPSNPHLHSNQRVSRSESTKIKNQQSTINNRKFAWLTLDEGDNDPSRFLAYLAKALEVIQPEGEQVDLGSLRPAQPPAIQAVLDRLINAVDEWRQAAPKGSQIVLVLDDYHLISAEPVHQSLIYLLDHLPPQLHLVIAGRADPPLPLARLRAGGEILELRAAELRFSKDETAELLRKIMRLDLSEADFAALESRTEGWIAGLQMAVLALRDLAGDQEQTNNQAGKSPGPMVSTFVQNLSGSNRYIMDYLVEEVLQRQSGPVQDFLLKTSILERICAGLCEAMMGSERSGDRGARDKEIEYLERANLFIVPLDDRREWYRYHRLFAELLRKRLALAFPGSVAELHRRASAWFEENGFPEEAIEHAFQAQDEARAAGLLAQVAEGLMIRSEFVTMRRWLDRLPLELLAAWPNLCLFHAWTLFLGNAPLKEVEARLALIQATDESQASKAAALRAYIAAFKGLTLQGAAYARQALAGLPEEETFLRGMAFIVLASCELSDGDPKSGQSAFEQAIRLGESTGNLLAEVIALASMAENYRKQGQLQRAETLFRQALDLAVDLQGRRLPIAGRALCGLGDLMREWNQLEAAERYLEEGIELIQKWGVLAIYTGYIPLARLKQAQGKFSEALEIIQKVQRIAAQTPATPIDDWVVDLAQASLRIAHGDLDLAEEWAGRRDLLQQPDPARLKDSEVFAYAHLRKYELVVLARLRLAQGRPAEALQLLDALLPGVARIPRLGLRIEIQLLRALSLAAAGKPDEAFEALKAALSLAEPAGYVRLFLDEGEPMFRLLSEAQRRKGSSTYVAGLLVAFEVERTPGVGPLGVGAPGAKEKAGSASPKTLLAEIEPLSVRELEVLSLLRSRLTVPEMAEELCVAESTLRSHIKSIYCKLGVHRRMDAVESAEELGLLTGR